ncbi:MAG: hypothetical protein ACTHK8_19010 [Ginsengibacter sp.]
MKLSKFSLALFMNLLIGLFIATAFGLNPLACVAGVNAAGAVMHIVKTQSGIVFFDGLAQEIWLPDVKQDFYPDNSFLSEPQDMSELVDNDAINLAEAGIDPDVLVNNAAYPIAMTDAGDTALRLILDTYDTTSTVVRNAVALELKYDQRALYTSKHKKALLKKFGIDAAYAYAPTQADAAKHNTVLDASADAADVILDRIIELQTAFNNVDADTEGRILVLNPNHAAIIAKEDKKLYKAFESAPGSKLFGFKIYMFTQNPIYIAATGVKAAKGTAFVQGTHLNASFAFMKDEVMKAQGTFKFFSKLNDPDNKGDVFNYQMRGLVSSIRNKYSAALLK